MKSMLSYAEKRRNENDKGTDDESGKQRLGKLKTR